jgi:E3 SUMO-protein ligase PIAS1
VRCQFCLDYTASDSFTVKKEAADPDIEVSSRSVTLKCPITYARMKTPCRGIGCKHNQCFDAASYLQLQEQAPTWTCPHCNKSVPWEQLVVDQYILDILTSTSSDTDQVTVEPDGRWHMDDTTPAPVSRKRKANDTPDTDDDDDIIELDADPPTTNGASLGPPQTLTPRSIQTPPVNGRESSTATSHRSASTGKRPRHNEVIDLTLSDEDEDQDARPAVKSRPSLPNVFSTTSTSNLNPNTPAYRTRPPDLPSMSSTSSVSPHLQHQQPSNAHAYSHRYQFQLPPLDAMHRFNPDSSFGNASPLNGSGSGYGLSPLGGSSGNVSSGGGTGTGQSNGTF